MTDPFTKLAYQTVQQSKSLFGLTHKTVSTQVMQWLRPAPERDPSSFGEANRQRNPLSPEILALIQRRMQALLDTDWQDAVQGVYPSSLLFDSPWEDFLRFYPLLLLDTPATWDRALDRRYRDFPETINLADYPSYYTQNFHYQTDGYLSDRSAQIYDIQVEILFNGAADPMRRRILHPLKASLQQAFPDLKYPRILDVACGTGRTLRMLRGCLPEASLYGTDLSTAYLRKANETLSQLPGELPQLLQANAEALPYQDNWFHGISCVFLFHELPAPIRQRVIEECYRVVQPGGSLVICDSIQTQDCPELQPVLENFATAFHEPFYRNYIGDDLVERLHRAGFTSIQTFTHFMSTYWLATKPPVAA